MGPDDVEKIEDQNVEANAQPEDARAASKGELEDDPKITNETLLHIRTHAIRCPTCDGIPAISYGKGLYGEPDPVYRLECAGVDGLISYSDTVAYVIEVWNQCVPSPHQKGVLSSKRTAAERESLFCCDHAREYCKIHRGTAACTQSEPKRRSPVVSLHEMYHSLERRLNILRDRVEVLERIRAINRDLRRHAGLTDTCVCKRLPGQVINVKDMENPICPDCALLITSGHYSVEKTSAQFFAWLAVNHPEADLLLSQTAFIKFVFDELDPAKEAAVFSWGGIGAGRTFITNLLKEYIDR